MISRRSVNRRDPREKIFLAFEGTKTEPQYFEGLIEKEEKEINAEIIPLYRGLGREFDSNPKKITEMVCDYAEWMYEGKYSVNLFIELILNVASGGNEGMPASGKLFKELKNAIINSSCITKNRKSIIDPDKALEICGEICKNTIGENVTIDIPTRPLCRERGDARFFILIDRDPGSFTEEQCVCVNEICKENEFELIISNPCFEVWLLLHFDVEKKEMLACTSATELKKLLEEKSIRKQEDLNFNIYEKIGRARKCLKEDGYCEDQEKLLFESDRDGMDAGSRIGTNMGMLIDIIFKGRYRSDEILR